jgi:16S rRNA G966 N2-methylase RsmD
MSNLAEATPINSQLAHYDAARYALQQCSSVDEVKNIRDKTEALRLYAKQRNDIDMELWCAEIKIRASRKIGEITKELEKSKGGRPVDKDKKTRSNGGTSSTKTQALTDSGLSKTTVSRCEKLADMDEAAIEAALVKARADTKPITYDGLIKAVEKQQQTEQRTAGRQEMAAAAAAIPASERWQVYHGDLQTFHAPQQYDFIITDPPYPKEFLPLYETLASRANDWLKDGGLLIAMCGQSYLDQIYALMSQHLDYYWTACYLTPGQPTPLRQVNVNTTWKPLLIMRKGKYQGKIFGDVFTSSGNDKDFHKWGQSISGMSAIIEGVCLPGQRILDPFCGAGTTGIAALKHGCLFDGLELDAANVNISRKRLHDASA